MTQGIYAIRYLYDNSYEYRYVGLSINIERRWKQHLLGAKTPNSGVYNYPLSYWIRKHYYAVIFDVLETVENADPLPHYEMKWELILRDKSHRLLNLVPTGGVNAGMREKPTAKPVRNVCRSHRRVNRNPRHIKKPYD